MQAQRVFVSDKTQVLEPQHFPHKCVFHTLFSLPAHKTMCLSPCKRIREKLQTLKYHSAPGLCKKNKKTATVRLKAQVQHCCKLKVSVPRCSAERYHELTVATQSAS